MKKISSLGWLSLIFGTTVAVEVFTWITVGSFDKFIVRLILLIASFLFLIKGSRFARKFLGIMYSLSGTLAVVAAIQTSAQPFLTIQFGLFAVFAFISAGFFFRSNVLRALSATGSGSSNAQQP